ncbi:MAG: malate synthase, partial [Deltaproteobacteria bacterium]
MSTINQEDVKLQIRDDLAERYSSIYTPEALAALSFMGRFNTEQKRLMAERTQRRATRIKEQKPITFLDSNDEIKGTGIKVQDARDGKFVGAIIPNDLQRQWLQGTGPAAKPNSPIKANLRNVAYALLSGADGWMFDGEDALGQITTMSLDNQVSLKLAIARDPLFLDVAEIVAREMNNWARDFFERAIVIDWRKQLGFTTKIFRARGLHLDDRHIRLNGESLSASIVDMTLYVVNNYKALQEEGSSIVLYLPKIQTAEEAGFWSRMLTALEGHLGLDEGTIKVYVLVEQLEQTFQLMEIRAALGLHFVGFNTGRWDYINSVSDANCWDPDFINPNIES